MSLLLICGRSIREELSRNTELCIEYHDEQAERLFQWLQKVSNKIEKIYTPGKEDEITLHAERLP
jgi:cystathionine beta-lyase/cystathionine gamma-synthase